MSVSKIMDLCGQQGCSNSATHTFIWPGVKSRRLICEKHLSSALSIGELFGVNVHIEKIIQEKEPVVDNIKAEVDNSKRFKIVGDDISDGYHTFGELYDHRNTLFIALCALLPIVGAFNSCFWIKDHLEGWDLIVATVDDDVPHGFQISYHVPNTFRHLYSDWCEKPITDYQFDGHTSADVLDRLVLLIKKTL